MYSAFITLESFTLTWSATLWGRGSGAFVLYESEAGDHAFFM